MSVQLIHKNSTIQDRRPTPDQLANGELSINYNEAGPFVCCKDTAGNIQQLGGVKFSSDAPADPVIGVWWFSTALDALFVYDGEFWQEVGGGGGGGSGGTITGIIGGQGINTSQGGSIVTVDADVDFQRGLGIDLGKIYAKLGANMSYDNSGRLQADVTGIAYKGTIDLTSDPVPSSPSPNDAYANTVQGAMSAAWQAALGLGATTVDSGDIVIRSDTSWTYIPTNNIANATNLGLANRNANTLDVTSSTGTNVTIPAATTAEAGLMTAQDKVNLAAAGSANPVSQYTVNNNDTSLVGGTLTQAVNNALIANGDIGGTPDLNVGDQLQVIDTGNPNFNPLVEPGRYFWDGTTWFVAGGGGSVESYWQRNGTDLSPLNDGDNVIVSNGSGTPTIELDAAGGATFLGKVTTASTLDSDPDETVVTKDFLTNTTVGGDGDLGYWNRNGNSLRPSTINDSVEITNGSGITTTQLAGNGEARFGGTIPSAPGVLIQPQGHINLQGDIVNLTTNGDQDIICDGSGLVKLTEFNLLPMEVVTRHDLGTGPNEVPLNGYLGTLAYKNSLSVDDGYAVANLPAAPTARVGQVTRVTDGQAGLTWGATVTGGGSAPYLVWFNGTNWTVLGA